MSSYRTLAASGRHEIEKVRGSRFIGSAVPVASTDDIATALEQIRREFHAARHHGFAWRLGEQAERCRAADDGEPAGSTGRPILERIDARELTNSLVVVTRYFGGTKLGVGGLVRAYGAAAEAVLDVTPARTVVLRERLVIEYAWSLTGVVESWLSRRGLQPERTTSGQEVRLVLELPRDEVESFSAELRERTAGRARIEIAP